MIFSFVYFSGAFIWLKSYAYFQVYKIHECGTAPVSDCRKTARKKVLSLACGFRCTPAAQNLLWVHAAQDVHWKDS